MPKVRLRTVLISTKTRKDDGHRTYILPCTRGSGRIVSGHKYHHQRVAPIPVLGPVRSTFRRQLSTSQLRQASTPQQRRQVSAPLRTSLQQTHRRTVRPVQ